MSNVPYHIRKDEVRRILGSLNSKEERMEGEEIKLTRKASTIQKESDAMPGTFSHRSKERQTVLRNQE